MATNVVKLERPATMRCTACGATTDAACTCGAAYVPAADLVAEYDKANPGRSTRQAAADLGVSNKTISKARSGVTQVTPVTGRDGKIYPAARPKPPPDLRQQVNDHHRQLMNFYTEFEPAFRNWAEVNWRKLDPDGKACLQEALYLCADGLAQLAQALEGR